MVDAWHRDAVDEVPDEGDTGSELWVVRDAVDAHHDRVVDTVDRESDLIESGSPLEERRIRQSVSSAHLDRFDLPVDGDRAAIDRAYLADPRPEHWISLVNPGLNRPGGMADVGPTENCAECARAFQLGLDGTPTVAAEIHPGGLPPADFPPGSEWWGESVDYTEQWAGRRFTEVSYEDIGRILEQSHGSAVVAGTGPSGGHAFNAFWDGEAVRLADAQQGIIDEWPPLQYEQDFPCSRAILFPRRNGAPR